MALDPGYSYVALRSLLIDGQRAFSPGMEVPDSTVTSQGWVVGVDVAGPGTPPPSPQFATQDALTTAIAGLATVASVPTAYDTHNDARYAPAASVPAAYDTHNDGRYATIANAALTGTPTVNGALIGAAVVGAAKTSDYTLALTDAGTVIEVDQATAKVITVPLDQDVAFPVGSVVTVSRLGAGTLELRPTVWNRFSNPSAEVDLTNWSLRGGTIAQDTGSATYGSKGVLCTATASAQTFGFFANNSVSLATMGLAVGDVISARVDAKNNTSPNPAQLIVRFQNSALGTISQVNGTNVTTTGVSKAENITIPAGTAYIQLIGGTTSTASGQTTGYDGLMLVKGATAPTTYRDGDSTGCVWLGAAHESQSMGPNVRYGSASVYVGQNQAVRLRKRAASEWVVEGGISPSVLKNTDTLYVDRDNGQPGVIAPTTPVSAPANLVLTANRAIGSRFVPSRVITATKIAFRVVTASGTDDPCDVAILDASLTRIVSSGATTGKLNSTGTKTVTIATTQLTPGSVYYAVLAANSTATVLAASLVGDLMGVVAPALEGVKADSSYPVPTTLASVTGTDTPVILGVRES